MQDKEEMIGKLKEEIDLLNRVSIYTWFPFIYLFTYLFISRERGREGEKYQCVVASYMAPTEGLACSPGMCPDWESN